MNLPVNLLPLLQAAGAVITGVEVRAAVPGGPDHERGVFATSDLPAGATVLSIPRSCVLTALDATDTPAGQAVARACSLSKREGGTLHQRAGTLALAMALINNRNDDGDDGDLRSSVLRAMALPSPCEVSHLPASWSSAEWEASPLSRSFRCVDLRRRLLRPDDDLHEMRRLLLQYDTELLSSLDCSDEEFRWGFAVVVSRSCCLYPRAYAQAARAAAEEAEAEEAAVLLGYEMSLEMQALVPLFDMLNHSPHPHLKWGLEDDELGEGSDGSTLHLQLVTLKAVTAGTELTINYGPRENGELAMKYGFTLSASWLQQIDAFTFVTVSPKACYVQFSIGRLLAARAATEEGDQAAGASELINASLKGDVWQAVFGMPAAAHARTSASAKLVVGVGDGVERLLRWARLVASDDTELLRRQLRRSSQQQQQQQQGSCSDNAAEAGSGGEVKHSGEEEGSSVWPAVAESLQAEQRALAIARAVLCDALHLHDEVDDRGDGDNGQLQEEDEGGRDQALSVVAGEKQVLHHYSKSRKCARFVFVFASPGS